MPVTFFDGNQPGNVSRKDGPGQEGPKLGLYSEESTVSSGIGLRMAFDDGRAFRYSHWVSAVTVGKLSAQDFSVTGTTSIDGKFTDSAGAAKDNYGTDDSTIYLTDTDTFGTGDAADVYAGGYLHMTDAAGEGYTYRIRSNDVGTSAGRMKLELYDNLAAAGDSESSCSITGSMFRNLAISDNAVDDLVMGVTMRDVTAAYFAWLQTWGVATILADETAGTIAAGTIACLSDGVNGAAHPMGGSSWNSEDDIALSLVTEPIIGYFLTAAVDTEYTPIWLTLVP